MYTKYEAKRIPTAFHLIRTVAINCVFCTMTFTANKREREKSREEKILAVSMYAYVHILSDHSIVLSMVKCNIMIVECECECEREKVMIEEKLCRVDHEYVVANKLLYTTYYNVPFLRASLCWLFFFVFCLSFSLCFSHCVVCCCRFAFSLFGFFRSRQFFLRSSFFSTL